jgi:ribosomal protein S18 acetylase RimI-like enzyme
VVNYRKFRNTDPPLLAEVWNETFTGRSAVALQSPTFLERFVLAKPYFDPEGLLLAEEDGQLAGFVHAGLSVGSQPLRGVTCLLGVRPDFRRRGIGTELLHRSEDYLRQRGAQVLYAGAKGAANPFYLGLYGGSDSSGFMRSDSAAHPFLIRRGYRVDRQYLVLQRDLTKALKIVDLRFSTLRQRYQMHIRSPKHLGDYAQECEVGQVEPMEFFLQDHHTPPLPGEPAAARTLVWEMEGFSWRWSKPAVGIREFCVAPDLRRQGLGKFLLLSLLRHLQEQYFEIVETHLEESDLQSLQFLKNFGFQQVDMGQVFIRQPGEKGR